MKRKILILVLGVLAATTLAATSAVASHWNDGDYPGDSSRRASSYINPDNGTPTENPDVNDNSNCANPDRYDDQMLSDPGTTNRNVHNDACLFKSWRSYSKTKSDFDGPASFNSFGVGYISACPDPDGAGPKYAFTRDRNGDGRVDYCFQSGYQDMGQRGVADQPGDFEYHARLNNVNDPGEQKIVFGYDPDIDGVSDTYVKSSIQTNWGDDGSDNDGGWDGGWK